MTDPRTTSRLETVAGLILESVDNSTLVVPRLVRGIHSDLPKYNGLEYCARSLDPADKPRDDGLRKMSTAPIISGFIMPFEDLHKKLTEYRQADTNTRKTILQRNVELLDCILPASINNIDSAMQVFIHLTYIAAMITYANILWRIEHQKFFKINDAFNLTSVIQDPQFASLNDFFEFHPDAPGMRLKKPLDEIDETVWTIFQIAQQEQLQRTNKTNMYWFDELNIDNPIPDDQPWLLPIQMYTHDNNLVVNTICMNAAGEFRFAEHSGSYQLPGEGIIEAGKSKNKKERVITHKTYIDKVLTEHLKQEHANLWMKASYHYDLIPLSTFKSCLEATVIENKPNISDLLFTSLTSVFQRTDLKNSSLLKKLIRLIDISIELPENNTNAVRTLRSSLQVEPFKSTDLYKDAFAFIAQHSIKQINVEPFCNTHTCGVNQHSHCLLMANTPLDIWFKGKFHDASYQMGDCLTGNTFHNFTLLQALERFEHIEFSHLLIALEAQLDAIECKRIKLEKIVNITQFHETRNSLKQGIIAVLVKLNKASDSPVNRHRFHIAESQKFVLESTQHDVRETWSP